jgi:hypothetical protein
MVVASGGDDRDLVVVALEADIRARDVVDDDGVEPLVLELAAPVLEGAVAVFGGEADQKLAGAALRREAAEDVGRRL